MIRDMAGGPAIATAGPDPERNQAIQRSRLWPDRGPRRFEHPCRIRPRTVRPDGEGTSRTRATRPHKQQGPTGQWHPCRLESSLSFFSVIIFGSQ